MKKTIFRWIALCLVMLMMLTACETVLPPAQDPTIQTDPSAPTEPAGPFREEALTAFKDMEYSRQEVAPLAESQQAVMDSIEAEEDVPTLMEKVFAFYELYHNYHTGYALANIYYNLDLTDDYWEEEYNFWMETNSEVNSLLDNMLYALAEHPKKDELEVEEYFGEGFFDDYEGESLWDETFTALMEKESALQAQYYEVSGEAVNADPYTDAYHQTYGAQIADIYVEMVKVRQEIATYAGYEDYASFAYDFYYNRDYTPTQAEALMDGIQTHLAPIYQHMNYNDLYDLLTIKVSQDETFLYTRSCANSMGGIMWEAFDAMVKAGLYDITYSTKKYDASFEIYISNYDSPFVFVNPSKSVQDKLTFTHEFGHFANDYASYGTSVGIDVAEFFSQGLEYLSIDYATGGKKLEKLIMFNSVSLYVEQSLYAAFEHEVYKLTGDELTRENVYKTFGDVAAAFGFGTSVDSRLFVVVPHFFISPMYIISYVVSNDAALQLYQLEQTEKGAGLAKYVENLDTTESDFLEFVQTAGLESPFAEGRIEKVAATFEKIIK